MKKIWIFLGILLISIGIGVFSTSFGNEEPSIDPPASPYTIRKSHH